MFNVKDFGRMALFLAIGVSLLCAAQPIYAAVSYTGNLVPADPLTWDSSTTAYVGDTADATMSINDGSVISSYAGYIADDAGVTASVTVDGTNSAWTCDFKMYIGYYGNGSLSVTNGGTVSAASTSLVGIKAGSTSTLSVDGAGSTWRTSGGDTFVGVYGNGHMSVTNGATAISSGTQIIGYKDNGIGTVSIDGAGSLWDCSPNPLGPLCIGNLASGALSITNGATVISDATYIGKEINSTGQAVIDGAGSSWTVSSTFYVGHIGQGTLNVTGGASLTTGKFTSHRVYIGSQAGPTNVATVSGEGSTWTHQGEFYVGNAGTGVLNILDGGLVSVANSLTIGAIATADGTINMSTGGMLALPGYADFSIETFLTLIGGEQSDNINWWNDSTNSWAPITTAVINQDYTLQYINTVGADLEGYTVLTVGQLPSKIPGDANGDCKVDGSDVTILAGNWQAGVPGGDPSVTWAMGDFNGDGKVDGSDVTILAGNWQYGVTAATAAVPEPSVLLLLVSSALFVLLRR